MRLFTFLVLFMSAVVCRDRLLFGDAVGKHPNVLFIAVDDLRPNLACYGDEVAITPNFDRLAARGTLFQRAYCQMAVCSPSRLSLITGRRPDTIKVWDLATHFRKAIPDVVTLPQHFKNHGYHTRSIGKILHGSSAPSKDPPSWSDEPLFDFVRDPNMRYALPRNLQGKGLKREASESADIADNHYTDGIVLDAALEALQVLSERHEPFFLGVGFRKPHLPFNAPKKYWDLYDRDRIPKPLSSKHPEGAPEYAIRTWNELEGYTDIPKSTDELTPEKIQELRHGYYACISYVDALLGRLLDKLDKLELSDKTVICLWGDHGYHLGEQGLWTKANNYELSARVPLILATPKHPAPGSVSDALVELVDLYPTLAETCGLPLPADLEGISMNSLLHHPDRPWKTAVFHQYPRSYHGSRHKQRGDVMGNAVRTERYRYVQWVDNHSGNVVSEELYDLQIDPNETRNLASKAEYQGTMTDLDNVMKENWKGALPDSR